jgi:hypothetical protein
MLRTWIQYNRPSEPNFTHAGLLLAFGLHEHLRVLTMTDAYRYLSQEHDITRLGLLLGLAASNRGTMHPAISKVRNPPFALYLYNYYVSKVYCCQIGKLCPSNKMYGDFLTDSLLDKSSFQIYVLFFFSFQSSGFHLL